MSSSPAAALFDSEKARLTMALSVGSNLSSVDDIDDAMRSRIDQDGLVVDNRIAIFTHAIFRRNLIKGHAFPGKLRAHGHRPVISIRTAMFMRDKSRKRGR